MRRGPRIGAIALAALLAACSSHGSYYVNKHPMVYGQVFDSILPGMERLSAPPPDPSNPQLAQEIKIRDPNDPMLAMKSVQEDPGFEWVFPGKSQEQSLRIHFVYGEFNGEDTRFTIRVEVRQPYAKTIDGQTVMVTQELADQRIQAAFGQMVDQVNNESWREIRDDPTTPAQPVIAALKQLVPWDMAQSGPSANPWAK